MIRKSRKLAVLLLVMILCLTGLAVGYGHWSETLQINTTVITLPGGTCAEWLEAWSVDPCVPETNDWTVDCPLKWAKWDNWSILPKNVGCTEVTLEDTDAEWCGYDSVIVVVHNAYPCYATKINMVIGNTGDLPVEISEVTLEALNFTLYDPDMDWGEVDLRLHKWPSDIITLYPGDSAAMELDLHLCRKG